MTKAAKPKSRYIHSGIKTSVLKALVLSIYVFCASPAWAALAANALQSVTDATNRTGPGSAYTLASFTITANRPTLLAIHGRVTTGSIADPVIGGTLTVTWVLVDSQLFNTAGGTNEFQKVWVYRTMLSSDTTGTVTITPGATDTWGNGQASAVEWTGANTGGTFGSAFVVQTAKSNIEGAAATTISETLAAFANANNRPYMACGSRIGTGTDDITPGTGTQLHELIIASEQDGLYTMWDSATADTTPTINWTTSDDDVGCVAIELAAQPSQRPIAPIIFQ